MGMVSLLTPGVSSIQRAREHKIRDAMGLPQRFTMPEGIDSIDVSDLDDYKSSADNIRGYMKKTRNPLIKDMELDFGESVAPAKSPSAFSTKGAPQSTQPAPMGYTPMEQGYSRELMNRIADAETRTLAKYRLDNPDTATLDIYSIGAESVASGNVGEVTKSKIGAPSRGLRIGQSPKEGLGSKTLLGE